jgi:tetratricopeptide (TPR) repeat protein
MALVLLVLPLVPASAAEQTELERQLDLPAGQDARLMEIAAELMGEYGHPRTNGISEDDLPRFEQYLAEVNQHHQQEPSALTAFMLIQLAGIVGSEPSEELMPKLAVLAEEAIKLAPGWPWGYYMRGNLLFSAGNQADAIIAFEKAVNCNPELPASHANLGMAYLKAGLVTEALASYQQAAELNPANPNYRIQLGKLYTQVGMIDAAEQTYLGILEIWKPRGLVCFLLGDLYYMAKQDMAKAEEYLGQAVELASGDEFWLADAKNKLARAARGMGPSD